ncbi:hypothetical protein N2152v2_005656 [Parachlorella kessleri]
MEVPDGPGQLDLLASRLNSSDIAALQALQAFAGLVPQGRPPAADEESEEEQEIAEALFGLAYVAADANGGVEQPDVKPEPAGLAAAAAAAAVSPFASGQPQAAALRLDKVENPGAGLSPVGGPAPLFPAPAPAVEDVAAQLAAAAGAADAADPLSPMTSPRKRQRKPNRNLSTLYEGFPEDEVEEEEAAPDGYHPTEASRRGAAQAYSSPGGGRGAGRASKAPRLDQQKPLHHDHHQQQQQHLESAANHASCPAAGGGGPPAAAAAPPPPEPAAAAGVAAAVARDVSTADSKDMSQRGAQQAAQHGAQQGASCGPAVVHPALLERVGVKRMSQVFIAHFIHWHKAQQAAGGGGKQAYTSNAFVQQGPPQQSGLGPHQGSQQAALLPPHLAQQAQQQAAQQQQQQRGQQAPPASPSARFQQLLASHGLAGAAGDAAAGLFAGAGAAGHAAPAMLPSLLDRQGVQQPVPALAGSYGLAGLAGEQGGYGGMLMGAPSRPTTANGMPLGLNGLPPIRTHPGSYPGGRARLPHQDQAPLGQHPGAYLGPGAVASTAQQPTNPFLQAQQQQGQGQQLPRLQPQAGAPAGPAGPAAQLLAAQQLLGVAGGAAGGAEVPHLLSLLMGHHQQSQQQQQQQQMLPGGAPSTRLGSLAGNLAGNLRSWGSSGAAVTGAGAWPGQQGGRGVLPQQHSQPLPQQASLQQEGARALHQQQVLLAQQAQQGASVPAGLLQHAAPLAAAAQQGGQPAGAVLQARQQQQQGAAPISKPALHSEAARALRTLQQALPLLTKHAQQAGPGSSPREVAHSAGAVAAAAPGAAAGLPPVGGLGGSGELAGAGLGRDAPSEEPHIHLQPGQQLLQQEPEVEAGPEGSQEQQQQQAGSRPPTPMPAGGDAPPPPPEQQQQLGDASGEAVHAEAVQPGPGAHDGGPAEAGAAEEAAQEGSQLQQVDGAPLGSQVLLPGEEGPGTQSPPPHGRSTMAHAQAGVRTGSPAERAAVPRPEAGQGGEQEQQLAPHAAVRAPAAAGEGQGTAQEGTLDGADAAAPKASSPPSPQGAAKALPAGGAVVSTHDEAEHAKHAGHAGQQQEQPARLVAEQEQRLKGLQQQQAQHKQQQAHQGQEWQGAGSAAGAGAGAGLGDAQAALQQTRAQTLPPARPNSQASLIVVDQQLPQWLAAGASQGQELPRLVKPSLQQLQQQQPLNGDSLHILHLRQQQAQRQEAERLIAAVRNPFAAQQALSAASASLASLQGALQQQGHRAAVHPQHAQQGREASPAPPFASSHHQQQLQLLQQLRQQDGQGPFLRGAMNGAAAAPSASLLSASLAASAPSRAAELAFPAREAPLPPRSPYAAAAAAAAAAAELARATNTPISGAGAAELARAFTPPLGRPQQGGHLQTQVQALLQQLGGVLAPAELAALLDDREGLAQMLGHLMPKLGPAEPAAPLNQAALHGWRGPAPQRGTVAGGEGGLASLQQQQQLQFQMNRLHQQQQQHRQT